MTHSINKLLFEIRFPDENAALQLRHAMSQTIGNELEHWIETACARYDDPDNVIRIDRLELDMGSMSSAMFQTRFAELFIDKLQQTLEKKIKSVDPDGMSMPSGQGDAWEAFIYFLRRGSLPWWSGSFDASEAGNALINADPERMRQVLFDERSNAAVWKRIAMQLDQSLKYKILELFPELVTCSKILSEWKQTIITELNAYRNGFSWADLGVNVKVAPRGNVIIESVLSSAPHIFHARDEQQAARYVMSKNSDDLFSLQLSKETQLIVKRALDALSPQTSERDMGFMYFPREKQEGTIHSNQGGSVLLTQFLSTCFTRLGLWNKKEWTDAEAQHRAVHLLHYMVTGQTKRYEYDQSLEKLICGIPLAEPVMREIELTQKELQEGNDLLQSVLEHWGALKNTSIHGLQETFLKRECIVQPRDGNWTVTINRKTEDVLLEKIPWGYSMITLPWNKYFIYVEW